MRHTEIVAHIEGRESQNLFVSWRRKIFDAHAYGSSDLTDTALAVSIREAPSVADRSLVSRAKGWGVTLCSMVFGSSRDELVKRNDHVKLVSAERYETDEIDFDSVLKAIFECDLVYESYYSSVIFELACPKRDEISEFAYHIRSLGFARAKIKSLLNSLKVHIHQALATAAGLVHAGFSIEEFVVDLLRRVDTQVRSHQLRIADPPDPGPIVQDGLSVSGVLGATDDAFQNSAPPAPAPTQAPSSMRLRQASLATPGHQFSIDQSVQKHPLEDTPSHVCPFTHRTFMSLEATTSGDPPNEIGNRKNPQPVHQRCTIPFRQTSPGQCPIEFVHIRNQAA